MYGCAAGLDPRNIRPKKIEAKNQKESLDKFEYGVNTQKGVCQPVIVCNHGKTNKSKIAASIEIAPPILFGHALKIA